MSSEATKGQKPDIYGQVHPVETPSLIARKRKEFEEELLKLPEEELECVKQAEEKCPQQTTDDFKLMFLRSEVFNADLAAKRYARYWEKRVEICGPDRAFLPMTQDGVLQDDEKTLKTGAFQYLEDCTDSKGHGVIAFYPPRLIDENKHTNHAIVRVLWYVCHACLESETAQKYGVMVLLCPGPIKITQMNHTLEKMMMESVQGVLPVRVSAFHVCRPPSFTRIVWPVIRLFVSKRTQKRVNFHHGSNTYILKTLENFGLMKETLPPTLGGESDYDYYEWLEQRRKENK